MGRRQQPTRPHSDNRHFTVEPEYLDTPDLHKLVHVFLNLALDRAHNHPAPTTGTPPHADPA